MDLEPKRIDSTVTTERNVNAKREYDRKRIELRKERKKEEEYLHRHGHRPSSNKAEPSP